MATTIRRRMMPRLWPAGGAIPVLLLAACAHVEAPAGLQAARTLPSRAWLERITEPGHEVAALASLSMPARAPASGEGPWDFHGAPFLTADGVSVYEVYTRRDALDSRIVRTRNCGVGHASTRVRSHAR